MAITILNPARFNDDGGLGGRNFIRAAFFDEGYGVSSSFKAYAQGAGIVPATAAFDGIGAGTAGDPLRMSQFSGFVVPSLVTGFFTTSLTEGSYASGGYERKGYSMTDPPAGDPVFPDALGSVSNNIINKPGGGTATFVNWSARKVPIKSSFIYSLSFNLTGGNHTGTWWTNLNYNGVDYPRSAMYNPTGDYNSTTDNTGWGVTGDYFFRFTGGTKTFTLS